MNNSGRETSGLNYWLAVIYTLQFLHLVEDLFQLWATRVLFTAPGRSCKSWSRKPIAIRLLLLLPGSYCCHKTDQFSLGELHKEEKQERGLWVYNKTVKL